MLFCVHSLWVKLICFLSDSLIVYKNADSSLHHLANYLAINFPPTCQIQANQEIGHTGQVASLLEALFRERQATIHIY